MDRPRHTMMTPSNGTPRRPRIGGRGVLIGVIAAAALALTACDGSLNLPSGLGSNLLSLPPLPTLPNRSTQPTPEPTPEATAEPTPEPTPEPTAEPTPTPTPEPTDAPSAEPSEAPSAAPTAEPSAPPAPTDPASDSTAMIILLILILGGMAAALIAWIIRQRSAETDDPGPPTDSPDDLTAPGTEPTEPVAAVEAPIAGATPPTPPTPEAPGDESVMAADLVADPSQDAAAPPTEQAVMPDDPQTPPTIGDDDPTSSFRTGPGA